MENNYGMAHHKGGKSNYTKFVLMLLCSFIAMYNNNVP